jgi:hypothetical protein
VLRGKVNNLGGGEWSFEEFLNSWLAYLTGRKYACSVGTVEEMGKNQKWEHPDITQRERVTRLFKVV